MKVGDYVSKKYYWIKLKNNFFDEPTIDFLLSQKNGCEYVVLYQMLCLKTLNNNGVLATEIGEIIVPFDAEKISRDTKYFDVDTVLIAMELYRKLGLIYESKEGVLSMSNFNSLVGGEASSTKRVKEYRERQKALQYNGKKTNETLHETLQCNDCVTNETLQFDENVTQEIRDKSKEIRDKSKEIDKEINIRVPYQEIVDLYNSICSRLPLIIKLTDKRKKSIGARFKECDNELSVFETLFNKANESDFLCGINDRGWKCDFDWLMNQQNMAKVLEDRYVNKSNEREMAF